MITARGPRVIQQVIGKLFKRFKTTNDWKLAPTRTESIFTISLLNPNFDYSSWAADASRLFSLDSKYISPKDFNYELPKDYIPEYAFIGRSNVGKSSLINCLLGNSKIVRTSKEPGCTRSVNYYGLVKRTGHAKAYLVDLPGYGFARASKAERQQWSKMIKDFLISRDISVLRRVYILIDSRRGPCDEDGQMMELLTKSAIAHQVIITKADLPTQIELRKTLNNTFLEIMKPKRHACLPIVHVVSAKSGYGLIPLTQSLAEINAQQWTRQTVPESEDTLHDIDPAYRTENVKPSSQDNKRN
mmetsp:Transcript_1557/g.2497  ORF Transcript_1557/g.2497 Transcript_1557/m.2497 type:complete len:301 (-) Transcript_1557:145-1047(-)|eukprot:CAMPEP_0185018560 /NCGR_PEP_ID=MMETSP1103-20130426/1239_1 /TAXON_ID=36769 /ORGANISM="Paraphysomonas bandaiensis, Strain Caron Lab Isolate" /LENGTH=300 /DNA_ID=CAMNT_0027548403 /DNA_START=110 /DNA_END=1012 /DNA_ORIENTATION=+